MGQGKLKKDEQITAPNLQKDASTSEKPPKLVSSQKESSPSGVQVAEKCFRYIPKSRRKEGQSPFEEVITTVKDKVKCPQALTKEDIQVLKGDLTMPLPAMGQPSSSKPPLKGKAQKELRRQGHKISPSKTGLGFTPPQPVYISAKGKSKKANVQHITIEEVEEDDNQQSSPRVSVFDRIEAPVTRTSVFDRLGVTKETRKESTLQTKKSIFSRLGNRSTSSKGENIKGKGKSIEIDSSKGDEETRSSIPSRMKRITSLDVDTEGPLKVKRRTIVLTGQPKGQTKVAKEEEMEYTTSYHVEVEEHSSSDSEDDDFPEAPPQLEDGGQPTIDDLKELNLGTPDEPRPIFVSALLSPEEEKAFTRTILEKLDNQLPPLVQQAPPVAPVVVVVEEQSHSSTNRSIETLVVVLAVIIIVGVVAGIIARVCRRCIDAGVPPAPPPEEPKPPATEAAKK
ncbi:hypothetical protein Vadar_018648 [Vaccinium darrowii]|uniref:Uncharacterized protein n=1 Tax=Vaccinium darrowii TaxID=229202 RepID=A0ACB7XRH3_9ERIC|nr:hypothetical protein Vadar_018648 [Vaccinium darrowii]